MPRRIILFTGLMLIAIGAIMTEAADYGKELKSGAILDAPGVMDAAISGNHLFYIGHSYFYAADLSDPLQPREIAKVGFPGAGRQIAVEGDIACVTARSDGLFIFDISDPASPRQSAHYDTLELATGIDLHGDLAFVAQRMYGIEIVDISDPGSPRHVSKIRTKEAQSVVVRGHYLYVGDWHSQVTIVDISDPRAPRIVARADLDGFGDGMSIQGDYLYAATGHHSREGQNGKHVFQRAPGDPGYGAGHGLEVWSVADPENPEFLSRVKFPIQHTRGYDMWTATAAGAHAFVADSASGVFVVDVGDPGNARTVARYDGALTGGIAVGSGAIYAACPNTGLVVLPASGMARYQEPDRGETVALPPPVTTPRPRMHRLYRPGGQIRDIAFIDGYAVLAAGMQGLRVVNLWPEVQEILSIETSGFAFSVDIRDNRLYAAEARAGLGIYEYTGNGAFRGIGRFKDRKRQAIRYVRVNGQSRYAVAESSNRFHFLDIADPAAVREVLTRQVAIIYGNQITHGFVDGRYLCTSDHRHPLRWYDMKAYSPDKIDTGIDLAGKLGFFDGAVSLGDRLLVTRQGGYQLAPALATNLEETPLYRCRGVIRGKPAVFGNALVSASRHLSVVHIVDISNLTNPRLLRQLKTKGNPSAIAIRNGSLIIADSYNGLLIYDDFVKTLRLDVDEKTFLPKNK